MQKVIRRQSSVLACLFIAVTAGTAQRPAAQEIARWQQEAGRVTIVRDDWGIAHVHGKSDADAVFGMEYAQAEDDFNRVETNYLNSLGRLAEAEGESKTYQDLRQRLYVNPEDLKKDYGESPAWLKKLMDAFADGLNFYLYTHPDVKPRAISRFEPWMALSFPEGSIGGDIERIDVDQLAAFYRKVPVPQQAKVEVEREPSGSNGIAIAPSNTVAHHALLLINPHTSFFFRSELQMTSDEGLNAYGAATWGQFFIYQGFNDRVGWMHTSSGVDAVDEYLETVTKQGDGWTYKYGSSQRPMKAEQVTIRYKNGSGMAEKAFTVFRTHHGPVTRQEGDKWVTTRLMWKPIEQLEQSFQRTKAHNYKEYVHTMELHANSSNNTIYADADGNIAYFHANFIPRRDDRFDYTKPVDGSVTLTDWNGELSLEQTPHLLNPKIGWLYNSNNAPWSAAGPDSPRKQDFPKYVEQGGETARGQHALRVLTGKKDFTLDGLTDAAYDSYLPWFEHTLPSLLKAWDELPASDPLKSGLQEQITALRQWDRRWRVDSVETSLAVFWGSEMQKVLDPDGKRGGVFGEEYVNTKVAPAQLLQALQTASNKLQSDFGNWRTPWGEINRFQRVTGDIVQPFSDAQPSTAVEFTSAVWGSLASFGARQYPGTKRWYGTSGNSFVAVVEFGPKVHAKAVTAGGESGHPGNPHFNDEAKRYATGNLRDVYFYPADVKEHTQKTYRPGNSR